MRIPLHKPYRAFEEFDRFNDARCEAYFAYVTRRYCMELVSVLVALIVAWLVAGVSASVFIHKLLFSPGNGLLVTHVRDQMLRDAICAALGATSVAVVALIVRDMHLRKVLARQLRGVTCAKCTYSLLGARVVDGTVQCPECGERFLLRERGLTEADIAIDRDPLLPNDALQSRPRVDFETHSPPAPQIDPSLKPRLLDRLRES